MLFIDFYWFHIVILYTQYEFPEFLKWVLMTRLNEGIRQQKAYFSSKESMVCKQKSLFLFAENLHNTAIDCFANYCACFSSITGSITHIEMVLKDFAVIVIFIKIWCTIFLLQTFLCAYWIWSENTLEVTHMSNGNQCLGKSIPPRTHTREATRKWLMQIAY